MQKKRLSYYCGLVCRDYLLMAPGIILESVVRKYSPCRFVEGIRVVDHSPQTFTRFTDLANDGLTLVAKSDPVRFKRIQREIRSIMNGPAIGGLDYRRAVKAGGLDLRCFYDEDDREMTIKLFASALIYLATYGRLYSRGVRRTSHTKRRFDSLCILEARRFMNRLGMAKTPWDPECIGRAPRFSYSGFILEEIFGCPGRAHEKPKL